MFIIYIVVTCVISSDFLVGASLATCSSQCVIKRATAYHHNCLKQTRRHLCRGYDENVLRQKHIGRLGVDITLQSHQY